MALVERARFPNHGGTNGLSIRARMQKIRLFKDWYGRGKMGAHNAPHGIPVNTWDPHGSPSNTNTWQLFINLLTCTRNILVITALFI